MSAICEWIPITPVVWIKYFGKTFLAGGDVRENKSTFGPGQLAASDLEAAETNRVQECKLQTLNKGGFGFLVLQPKQKSFQVFSLTLDFNEDSLR